MLTVSTAMANEAEFKKATGELCDKMKSCALAEMGDMKDIPEQMRPMITAALDKACTSLSIYEESAAVDSKLTKAGTACIESMNKMSCDDMQNFDGDAPTSDCKEFHELAEKYNAAQQ